ncbi:MAG: hypothetical protein J5772_06080 [Clostridia bacterium]|nr:hypothetical protein [Clostridia bacterium]
MKRIAALFVILIIVSASFTGCLFGDDELGELPLSASDPEALMMWDEYPILDNVPRFRYDGIFKGIYEGKDGSVVISYVGISEQDYLNYTDDLILTGYELKEDSAIWIAEGLSGVPQFMLGELELAIVWTARGSMDISVSPAATD